jgi:hypothetical protein
MMQNGLNLISVHFNSYIMFLFMNQRAQLTHVIPNAHVIEIWYHLKFQRAEIGKRDENGCSFRISMNSFLKFLKTNAN